MKTLRALFVAFVLCLAFAPVVEFEGEATAGEEVAAYAADLSPAMAFTVPPTALAAMTVERPEAFTETIRPEAHRQIERGAVGGDGELPTRMGGFDVLKEPWSTWT